MDFIINLLSSRKCTLAQNKVIEKIIREQEHRRKYLSELSFKEKIHILVELQKMAKGVARHGKVADRIIWQV
jgi:hypothetical protein